MYLFMGKVLVYHLDTVIRPKVWRTQARRKQFSIGRVFGKSIFMSGAAAIGQATGAT